MRTVDIPGGTATLRDQTEMTERQRRLVKAVALSAITDINVGDNPAEATSVRLSGETISGMLGLVDAGIIAGLVSWTLDGPLPTMDTVQDLPGGVYDALAAATRDTIAGIMASVNFDPSPDPQSPTPPSSASNGPLTAEAAPTPTPSTAGENTPTASSTAA